MDIGLQKGEVLYLTWSNFTKTGRRKSCKGGIYVHVYVCTKLINAGE